MPNSSNTSREKRFAKLCNGCFRADGMRINRESDNIGFEKSATEIEMLRANRHAQRMAMKWD
jgi:hypothetical protein